MFSLVIFIQDLIKVVLLKYVNKVSADEGTRTLTSLGHKILNLARLPDYDTSAKIPAKVLKKNFLENTVSLLLII